MRAKKPPASALSADAVVVDLRVLTTVGAIGSEFLDTIVALFTSEAPALVAALQGAAHSGDNDQVRRLAHTLRGRAAMLGARRLAEVCAVLERRGGAATSDDLDALVAVAAESCRTLLEVSRRERDPAP